MTTTKNQAMVSKANASAKKFSTVNPAQLCKKILENTAITSAAVNYTSPTSFFRINPKSKNIYKVLRGDGVENIFATLDDAINYVNTLDANVSFADFSIRPYGKRWYCTLAVIWR